MAFGISDFDPGFGKFALGVPLFFRPELLNALLSDGLPPFTSPLVAVGRPTRHEARYHGSDDQADWKLALKPVTYRAYEWLRHGGDRNAGGLVVNCSQMWLPFAKNMG